MRATDRFHQFGIYKHMLVPAQLRNDLLHYILQLPAENREELVAFGEIVKNTYINHIEQPTLIQC